MQQREVSSGAVLSTNEHVVALARLRPCVEQVGFAKYRNGGSPVHRRPPGLKQTGVMTTRRVVKRLRPLHGGWARKVRCGLRNLVASAVPGFARGPLDRSRYDRAGLWGAGSAR